MGPSRARSAAPAAPASGANPGGGGGGDSSGLLVAGGALQIADCAPRIALIPSRVRTEYIAPQRARRARSKDLNLRALRALCGWFYARVPIGISSYQHR